VFSDLPILSIKEENSLKDIYTELNIFLTSKILTISQIFESFNENNKYTVSLDDF